MEREPRPDISPRAGEPESVDERSRGWIPSRHDRSEIARSHGEFHGKRASSAGERFEGGVAFWTEETKSRIKTGVFYGHLTPHICPQCGQKSAVGKGVLMRIVGENCLLVSRKARNTGIYRAS